MVFMCFEANRLFRLEIYLKLCQLSVVVVVCFDFEVGTKLELELIVRSMFGKTSDWVKWKYQCWVFGQSDNVL